jgi:complex III assembly factor LYRM7
LAKQVASLLRQNVVQGESKDGEHFSKSRTKGKDSFSHDTTLSFLLELNITKDTELGDNDTIKTSKNIHRKGKRRAAKATACCGGH